MRLFATVFNKTDNLGGSQAAMVEPELGINLQSAPELISCLILEACKSYETPYWGSQLESLKKGHHFVSLL